MGFEQVFDKLTFKHRDGLRKQFQSLVDYVLNHCFGHVYAMLSKVIWGSLISAIA